MTAPVAALDNFPMELQAEIFKRLNGDAILKNLLAGLGGRVIFDQVPQGADFPFIVIGDDNVLPWNTKTSRGYRGTSAIHVWTQDENKRGDETVKTIANRIVVLLDNYDLNIPNRRQVAFTFNDLIIETDEDTVTRDGRVIFDFIFGGLSYE